MAVRENTLKETGLPREDLLGFYRNMVRSRLLDDEEISLKRKNLIFFQISGAGHEAVLTALGYELRPGHDWFYPYYRDRALCLMLGMTPKEMLMSAVAAVGDPNSHGRQMPSHWGHARLNIVSQSSPTGTQVLQAVGCAQAALLWERIPGLPAAETRFHSDEVTYVSLGDGTTSQGEFWEGLSTACTHQLPVLFHIEDNGYAISVPVEQQTPGGNISALSADSRTCCPWSATGRTSIESPRRRAPVSRLSRARRGPSLPTPHVTRPYCTPPTTIGSIARRRSSRRRRRDCLKTFARTLIENDVAGGRELARIREDAQKEIRAAADGTGGGQAGRHARPPSRTSTVLLTDPPERESRSPADGRRRVGADRRIDQRVPEGRWCGIRASSCSARRRRRIAEEALGEVTGKGGVFKVTHKLQTLYGSDRVFNSPLAEANIVGRAIGMATRGLKPVVEIQFFDYVWPAMMQIRNELSMLRWRSDGDFACPVVMRVPIGGYLQGGAVYHSQSGESIFTHCPGLRVVMPSNALDANGLLRTAIRCEDPVLYLEHKHLYRQPYAKGPYPGKDFMVPFGARLHRVGTDATIVTYGALVRRSEMAAKQLGGRHRRRDL
jgi:2-oxoisovalerate dehydrogenase E1 component